MSRINHAKHAHRGRPTECAFSRTPAWARHSPAKAANAGRSLSADEKARWAASHGFAIAS